jgi:hypothetical protein
LFFHQAPIRCQTRPAAENLFRDLNCKEIVPFWPKTNRNFFLKLTSQQSSRFQLDFKNQFAKMANVASHLSAFRQLMSSEQPDIQAGKRLLSLIKVGMIQEQFRLLPPFPEESLAQTRQQLLIARNISLMTIDMNI